MLFLLLCKSGENKEVPNIQSINQSINGEHPPPPRALRAPPGRGAGRLPHVGPPGPLPGWGADPANLAGTPGRGAPAREAPPARVRAASRGPPAASRVVRRARRPRGWAPASAPPPGPLPGLPSGPGGGGAGRGAGSRQVAAAGSLRDPQQPARGAPTRSGVPERRSPSASWGVNAESCS